MNILLIGMWGLYNRGCEAIIWGSVKIIKEIFPNASIAIAIGNPENSRIDRLRLPNLDVEIYPLVACIQKKASLLLRIIRRIIYKITGNVFLYRYRRPIGYPEKDWDLILEVGGDTYADNPVLKFNYDKWLIKKKGYKVGLWGMNLGPYDQKIISIRKQKEAFSRYEVITVRDKFSKNYLNSIGIKKNLYLMADPAFEMDAQEWDTKPFFPKRRNRGIIGINLNPSAVQSSMRSKEEIIELLQSTSKDLNKNGFGVLLVPHCFPPACPFDDDDTLILKPAFEYLKKEGLNIGMLPNEINSPQVKFAISQCDLFTGIRMHSTIAAWSSNIPVLSISYSQKSLNYNSEIYGHQKYVLNIASLTSKIFIETLLKMANNLEMIKKETIKGVDKLRKRTKNMISEIKKYTS
ncbi:MAG: polysaccharide pyruvyl transferase family protein [Candidatus Delongbacteria bacterium]|nr:polysaccharide pyruvyl transferase family protein [Candidatus Delongbacteria bacterium]